MAPIRVGFVGLASVKGSTVYKSGQWGLQHLSALLASSDYRIVAVCNSSVESSQRAISFHDLGEDVKAYGSPDEIAGDPNVDLVLVSVNIRKHRMFVEPALLKGKQVFVEFPVAPTLEDVERLAKLAAAQGVRTLVGSQARSDPALRKLEDLVNSKVIGDIVTSSLTIQSSLVANHGWPKSSSEFLEYDSGLSRVEISLGHGVLGDFKSVQSSFKLAQKTNKLLDGDGNVVQQDFKATAPDQMMIQSIHENGVLASLTLRNSPSPVKNVGFRWVISGSEGELELTADPGIFQFGMGGAEIEIRRGNGEPEKIKVEGDEAADLSDVLPSAHTVARMWKAFAQKDEDGYLSLAGALKVHRAMKMIRDRAVWAP